MPRSSEPHSAWSITRDRRLRYNARAFAELLGREQARISAGSNSGGGEQTDDKLTQLAEQVNSEASEQSGEASTGPTGFQAE